MSEGCVWLCVWLCLAAFGLCPVLDGISGFSFDCGHQGAWRDAFADAAKLFLVGPVFEGEE